ncbi:MAG: biotin synthase BioB [Candidatus Omnitrophica bacterium]|nr:biotin synthase BioB [Candidatus Omnitrophota bacterium]
MENSFLKINFLKDAVLRGAPIGWEDALFLANIEEEEEILALAEAADEIRKHFCSDKIDLCSLINAKSGRCSEDCAFCAQSARHKTGAETYPLLDGKTIAEAAGEAERNGAHRFCIVTSGGSLSDAEFEKVIRAFLLIHKSTNLELDGSLGFLSDDRMRRLREAGVSRINHNLETSREYYPQIVKTHRFEDRVDTVKRLKNSGFEICSGGIIGMGESREDRLRLAFELRDLSSRCVPINILNARPGTPLENEPKLTPLEIIKTVACFRFILPEATIKLAGGREANLGQYQELALKAGANGIIIGGYLTTSGSPVEEDFALIERAGFTSK